MTLLHPPPPSPTHAAVEHTLEERLAARLAPLATQEGFAATSLPGVQLITSHCGHARTPLMYEPSLVIIVQGNKTGYLEDRIIHYGAGHYLIQAMPLPFECETHASDTAPLLGLSVSLDMAMLGEMVRRLPSTPPTRMPAPMAAVDMDADMGDSVMRLIDCLHDHEQAAALGDGRIREVLFAALRGPQGASLRQLVAHHGQYSRIAEALTFLHQQYTQPLNVESLAQRVNMSASHFHHHFKRTTQLAPMQYLKRLRLLKARLLLTQQGYQVAQAGSQVGYQSASQFSRDYKRYFGQSPLDDRQSRISHLP
ncbi:AraC family transcriptional regulator [Chromohalobacter marismortui]|uniref:AraC family transcriptional regulator n=1 Tax=Chromohalobacter marismortui TaxID=42055 RepID=A0A4R7NS05_9GAMM|nr:MULTISPECIES: AraC family transcriptional regulator [Chromohalobacter]MCI0509313.1 AraC family transcriptional regulator [Chromohalobacter sp.]MCI0593861.1 AraC family transcriptional regulator [Chromohalobacter sp.]TDU23794.1 AraC family transcriptional regulator [Chromohalobacter marismortui]